MPPRPPAKSVPPRRRRRRAWSWFSFAVLLVLVTLGVLARTQFVADRVARMLRERVERETGLRLAIGRVYFSFRHLSVRAEELDLVHPREGTLAHVDALEVVPAFTSFFRSNIKIASISVDGGRVDLRFRHGQLVNGPTIRNNNNGPARLDLPFRDLAVSDVYLHLEHDELGTLDLPSVDVDVHNDEASHRVLLGVLTQGGAIQRARCFNGPIDHVEARVDVDPALQTLHVAMARLEAGRIGARVVDTTVPLNLRGDATVEAEVSGPLPELTCPAPERLPLHGEVSAHVRARGNIQTRHVQASAEVHGRRLTFELINPDRTFNFGAGEEVDLRVSGTEREVRVDSLRIAYAGGTVTSPGSHPERPLVAHLADLQHPSVEGHLEISHVDFPHLMHDVTVTDFTKVLWDLSAGVEVHGDLWRFGAPADPQHPALLFDLDGDTHNFAVLRDFYQRLPQRPIVAIPHARVRGQITVDPAFLRFRRLTADFGRSQLEVGAISIRLSHRPFIPDFYLEGGRATNVHLEDVRQVAEMPVGGLASFTLEGSGPFSDIVLTGSAHLRGFDFNGLPLGDFDTRAETPFRYRLERVDFPVVDGHSGRSNYVAHNGFLDFSRWSLRAGARVTSNSFFTADFYHMFEFEGDPTFEPFVARTMPRCASSQLTHGNGRPAPCVNPDSPEAHDPRRPAVPAGTDTGHLEATVDFVLGRPGDDPGGVMNVDLTARDWVLRAYDETVRDLDAHVRYQWLVRSRGYRGARVQVDYLRGHVGGGLVEGSGSTDLGGALHVTAYAHGVSLADLDLLHNRGLAGNVSGLTTIEGLPDSPRITADVSVHGLVASNRNFGDATLNVRSSPEEPHSSDPHARPPRNHYDLAVTALAGVLRTEVALSVPWHGMTWRDPDGVVHPDWERNWSGSLLTGHVEFTRVLDLLPLLPTSMVARLGSGARANVRARVDIEHALLGDLEHADARVALPELDVSAQGVRLALAPNAVLAGCLHDGRYWIDPAAAQSSAVCSRVPPWLANGRGALNHANDAQPVAELRGPEGVRLGLSGGGSLAGRLNLALRGEADLSRLASMVSGVTWARGTARVEVNVRGDMQNPELAGTLSLDGGALGADALPDPVTDIHLLVRMTGTEARLEQARAQFGPGSLDLQGGFVRLHGRELDRVEVPVRVENLALRPSSGVEVALNADALLSYAPTDEHPLLSGDVTLLRVRYTRPINLVQDSSGEAHATSTDSSTEAYDPRNARVQLDLRLHAREPARVLNNLLDAEIRIAEDERPFRILGNDQRVGILGTLTVPHGRVLFNGYDFEVRRGRIEFDNPERIQPNFDVAAQVDIRRGADTSRGGTSSSNAVSLEGNQWRVGLHAYGTPERFALDMSSEPALSRVDIAFLLAFRMTRAEFDQIAQSGNLTSAGQGIAVEALATATGVNQAVGRAVRTFIPVVDEFRIGSAYSPAQGRTVPQVSMGRRINDRIRIGATVNTTDQREMRATGDVRIDDRTSLQVGYDNFNDTGSSQVGNIGADLRWRVEFE